MNTVEEIIIKPLLTEKTNDLTEKENRYNFLVHRKANKYQIKKAVEELFDVKVLSVNTMVRPGKLKRFGQYIKRTSLVKRAYVQIEKGQKIEFFKNI